MNCFAQIQFDGAVKGTNKRCSLQIVQTWYENNVNQPQNFRADVVATLEDNHHASAQGEVLYFRIAPTANPTILSGYAQNQKDIINVVRGAGANDLQAYAVKWWHQNHFHSAQCLNLRRVK